jgi:hypothetical protein
MITPDTALSAIPGGLRTPLLEEFHLIISNFMEHRWSPSELFGGRFSEIVYTILEGYANKSYASSPYKPTSMVDACRQLENNTTLPRSFRILIPRLLPALYEIRNNRNVGHVGGDVEPDYMDSTVVVSISSWIIAELIRVFHGVTTKEAQEVVDILAERRFPLVWKSGDIRRVLNPTICLKDQILLLLGSVSGKIDMDLLFKWTGNKNKSYFIRIIRQLHDERMVEFYEQQGSIEILPPGVDYACGLLQELQKL